MLSQTYDMESFAAPGDKMTLLYAPDPGGEGAGPGQVLYAAIKGEGRDLECNVFRPTGKEDYGCYGKGGAGGGGVSLRAGMVTPTPKAIDSPAEPVVWTILFSRIVAGRRPKTFEKSLNSVIEMTATGIEALIVMPTLRTR